MPLLDNYTAEAWLALLIVAPPLIWGALEDLKHMMIPDTVHFILLGGFAIWAVLFLGPEDIAWRVFAGAAVFVIGLALVMYAGVGGGDVKMAAAITPFVAGEHLGIALQLLSLCLIVLYFGTRAGRKWANRGGGTAEWVSMEAGLKSFPMGVAIAAAGVIYRALLLPAG